MPQIIQISHQVSDKLRKFLSKNVLGTPNQSMVYQQLTTKHKLGHLPSPIITSIERNGEIIGCCCFCKRRQDEFDAYYVRYFSFDKKFQSSQGTTMFRRKKSVLRQEVTSVINGDYFDANRNQLIYAYVDPDNVRSKKLCDEFGFRPMRQFKTYNFSRITTKRSNRVVQASSQDKSIIRSLLKQQYHTHSCYTEENLFYQDHYYILKDNDGQITAGVQATPEHWKVHSLGGKIGHHLIKTLSSIPIIKQLINKDFSFLAFNYLLINNAHLEDIEELLEGVLNIHHLNTGLISLDQASEEAHLIEKIPLGLLNKFSKPVAANVIYRINQKKNINVNLLENRPFFISTFDLT